MQARYGLHQGFMGALLPAVLLVLCHHAISTQGLALHLTRCAVVVIWSKNRQSEYVCKQTASGLMSPAHLTTQCLFLQCLLSSEPKPSSCLEPYLCTRPQINSLPRLQTACQAAALQPAAAVVLTAVAAVVRSTMTASVLTTPSLLTFQDMQIPVPP